MSRAALLTGFYPWRLGMQRGAIGAFRASLILLQTSNKQTTNNSFWVKHQFCFSQPAWTPVYLFYQRYCPMVAIGLQWWVNLNFHATHCNSLVIQYNSWEDAKSEKKTNVFFLVKSSSHLFTFILNLFANSRKISNPAGRSGQVLISLDHQNSESCQLFLR